MWSCHETDCGSEVVDRGQAGYDVLIRASCCAPTSANRVDEPPFVHSQSTWLGAPRTADQRSWTVGDHDGCFAEEGLREGEPVHVW